jgi:lipase chaperone LimK
MPTKQLRSPTKKHRATSPQVAAALADQAAWQQTIEAICARLCDCTTEALSEEMSYDEVLQRAAKLEDEQARALLDAGFNDGWVA